jgi:NitT/TauT family transport system ATP-binding protein
MIMNRMESEVSQMLSTLAVESAKVAERVPPLVADRISHSVQAGRGRGPLHHILNDISFTAETGEIVGLVGPSGCGKTTLLNMFAGLLSPTSGRVLRSGKPTSGCSRDVGYMTARSGLLPWRTARRNVELGLEVRKMPRREARERAIEYLELVHLQDYAEWYPGRLSQGMRQRVSLARTLAFDPEIILMDEPFAALDVQTKARLQQEFLRICEGSARTVLWVTHDVNEAVAVCDRVLAMSGAPGSIRAEVLIDLERPRTISQLRGESHFQELCSTIWELIDE